MKPRILCLMGCFGLSPFGKCAAISLPDQPMGKQLEWAESAMTDLEWAKRLEAFWPEYLSQEKGGVSSEGSDKPQPEAEGRSR